ncbi:hypothetical protein ABK040_005399 [Willaertia magna]
MGIFTTYIFLSFFLLISLCVHSSFSCYFYLNQNSPQNNNTEAPTCVQDSSIPCTSYCQIINYINTLNFTNITEPGCTINLMSDYMFNESDNCPLKIELNSLTFIGGSTFGKINFTMNFENTLHFDVTMSHYIKFYSLNINNVNLQFVRNIYFYNSIISGLQSKSVYQLYSVFSSFIAVESTLNFVAISRFKFITGRSSIINGLNAGTFDNFSLDNCKFISTTTFDTGNNVNIRNGEFLSQAKTNIAYVIKVNFENNVFQETDVTNGVLDIRYSQIVSLLNTKVYSKENWALVTGVSSIIIFNLYSTSSLEILHPLYARIDNSEFVKSTTFGLKLADAQGVVITNTNFTQCSKPLQIENTRSPHFQATVTNCFFIDNNAVDGGAIYIASNVGEIILNNCVFSSNVASSNGGALYLTSSKNNSTFTIVDCKFIKNLAGDILITNINEGNGGAIYAVGKTLEITDNTVFLENSAIRGGAIFTNSFIPQTNALFKSNAARLAGGGIFLFKTDIANNNNFNFQNNTAMLYGKDKASFIKKVIVQYYDDKEIMTELTVFSGLYFNIYLEVYDIFDNQVTRILETPSYKPNFDENIMKLHTVSSDFVGLYKFYIVKNVDYILPPNGDRHNFTIIFPESSAIAQFKVINCPSNYDEMIVGEKLYCERKKEEFPLGLVISLSVLGAVLFFIVGLSAGILILYGIMKVINKLKRLEKKEKAELEIERKIIDKKIIFGDSVDETPLLEDDRTNNNRSASKKNRLKERKESFLIPVEELKIEKKIGEGGCGTVYSAKWVDNTVAIKSIKITDELTKYFSSIKGKRLI